MTLAFIRGVRLAAHTTFGVGGPARAWLSVDAPESLREALCWAADQGLAVEMLGGGSNVLVADRGLDALVIQLDNRGRQVAVTGEDVLVEVGAGHDWDTFVAWAVAEGFAGLECLSGIPGRVGAAPLQNVGAYGQEVSQTIVRVQLVDRETGETSVVGNSDCGFGYRDSIFKGLWAGRYIVWQVCFRLRPGGKPLVAYPQLKRALQQHCSGKHVQEKCSSPSLIEVRTEVMRLRRSKSMVFDTADENHRSAGSFFVNPMLDNDQADEVAARAADVLRPGEEMPRYATEDGHAKLPAAWLIERAGMAKGFGQGRVGLSTKHTLALVNRGGASAADIVVFAGEVRRRVFERFGVTLHHEPRLLGFDPSEVSALSVSY